MVTIGPDQYLQSHDQTRSSENSSVEKAGDVSTRGSGKKMTMQKKIPQVGSKVLDMEHISVDESNWLRRLRDRPIGEDSGSTLPEKDAVEQQPTDGRSDNMSTAEDNGHGDSSVGGISGNLSYVSTLPADSETRSPVKNADYVPEADGDLGVDFICYLDSDPEDSRNDGHKLDVQPEGGNSLKSSGSKSGRVNSMAKKKRRFDPLTSKNLHGMERFDRVGNNQVARTGAILSHYMNAQEAISDPKASRSGGSSLLTSHQRAGRLAYSGNIALFANEASNRTRDRPKKPMPEVIRPVVPDVVPSVRLQSFAQQIQAPVWQYDPSLSTSLPGGTTKRKGQRTKVTKEGESRTGPPPTIEILDDSPKAKRRSIDRISSSVSAGSGSVPTNLTDGRKRRRLTY